MRRIISLTIDATIIIEIESAMIDCLKILFDYCIVKGSADGIFEAAPVPAVRQAHP